MSTTPATSQQFSELHGRVMQITDKLGRSLRCRLFHILVDNDTTAGEILATMNRRKMPGELTFMPLNRMENRKIPRLSSPVRTRNESYSRRRYQHFHSPEWSISNFPYSLTRSITSRSMKNLAFHHFLRWKIVILLIILTTLSLYVSLWKVGIMYFLNLGVIGLKLTIIRFAPQRRTISLWWINSSVMTCSSLLWTWCSARRCCAGT